MNNDSHFFDWLDSAAADGSLDLKMPHVKEESQPEYPLLSPPSSSPPPLTTPSVSLVQLGRQRSTKSASPRVRPYPELRSEDTIGMSGTSGYGNIGRPPRLTERRSSDGDQPAHSASSSSYGASSARHSDTSSPPSSSLMGAMGIDAPIMHTRYTSPRPRSGTYSHGMHPMGWSSTVSPDPSMLPGVPGDVSYISPNASHDGGFGNYNIPSASSSFPNASYTEMISGTNSTTFPSVMNPYAPSTSHSYSYTDLQRRVVELEQIERQDKERIRQLEAQLASRPDSASRTSPSFEASWRARTEARVRQYCSLNRAGNALCAWHDSRRERRMYPPRMAPPGTLNCGCTYEEALFEESLSRHHVGSYLPGDSVRMDPALRNPLLKLLQERYNYRDGDFERDPRTGNWVHGEGPAFWEQQIATGVNPRRPRGEQHR